MIQGFRYSAGDLLAVNLSLGHGATTRYARVEFLDGHSDALTLVDVTGRQLTGNIVSARLMTDAEVQAWNDFGTEPCFADNQPLQCWQYGKRIAKCSAIVVTVGVESEAA